MRSNGSMITAMTHQIRQEQHEKSQLYYNLATVDLSGSMYLWNAVEMVKINIVEKDDAVNCICNVPGGSNEMMFLGYVSGLLILVHASKNGNPELLNTYIGVSLDKIAAENSKSKTKSEDVSNARDKNENSSGSLAIGVSALHCSTDRNHLFCGVDHGYIRHFNLINLPKTVSDISQWSDHLKHVKIFRAHKDRVDSIEYVEKTKVLIVSCANEKSVSVWTLEGACIGNLGSNFVWKLDHPQTYLNQTCRDVSSTVIPRCGDNARALERVKKMEIKAKLKQQRKEEKINKLLDFNYIKDLDDDDDDETEEE